MCNLLYTFLKTASDVGSDILMRPFKKPQISLQRDWLGIILKASVVFVLLLWSCCLVLMSDAASLKGIITCRMPPFIVLELLILMTIIHVDATLLRRC